MMQCTGCQRRCTKCGMPAEEGAVPVAQYEALFCPTCNAEYQAYLDKRAGKGDNQAFWLNQAWEQTWETWLAHQEALIKFKQTKEFQRLLNEPPDFL